MRSALFDAIGLDGVTLVGQDWGGLIGLRLVGEHPDRFARVVAANTGLPLGDAPMSDAFLAWQNYSQTTPEFHVGGIVKGGCRTKLSDAVVAAYDAPFPDDTYKAGARQFPLLVPTKPDDPARADQLGAWKGLEAFDRPFLTAFSDSDPVTGGGDRVFQAKVPGAKAQAHTTIEGGGHFLQEDRGPDLAQVVVDFVRST
jgi:haloalkane dehalogenase